MGWRAVVRFPEMVGISLYPLIPLRLRSQTNFSAGTDTSCLGVKQSEREAKHSPLSTFIEFVKLDLRISCIEPCHDVKAATSF
jgi:hypothetical protein